MLSLNGVPHLPKCQSYIISTVIHWWRRSNCPCCFKSVIGRKAKAQMQVLWGNTPLNSALRGEKRARHARRRIISLRSIPQNETARTSFCWIKLGVTQVSTLTNFSPWQTNNNRRPSRQRCWSMESEQLVTVTDKQQQKTIKAEMLINRKALSFQIDCGASVNVIPQK